jgi:transcriptional regulator with XRE-family HTH domain
MAEKKYHRHQNGLRRGDPARIAAALGISLSFVRNVLYGTRSNAQVDELVALAKRDYDTFVLRLAREKELTELKRRVQA